MSDVSVPEPATERPGLAAPRVVAREEAAAQGALGIPARLRLSLQHQAPLSLRRHVVRGLVRFVALVTFDLAAFGVLRELVRSVRDHAVLGGGVAGFVQRILPGGHLNGWKYATALYVGLLVTGNYGAGDRRRDATRLFAGVALATALPMWDGVWNRPLWAVLLQYGITVVAVWAVLVAERYGVDRLVTRVRPSVEAVDVLFVGPAEECKLAAASPAFGPGSEFRRAGFVDVAEPPAPGALGRLSDFAALLAASGADAVVICGRMAERDVRGVVDAALASGCQVLTMPRLIGLPGIHAAIVWRHGQPIVELTAPSLRGWQLALKRTLDVVGSAVPLALAAPLMALLAVAIRLDSPGPAMFGHRRVGRNARAFRCWKFRSMHADAETRLRSDPALYAEYVANNFKLPDHRDPRLTRVGRFLRRTSLDELPQLFNVLIGQMSLVGPRPIVPEELGEYGQRAPAFLSLKPGITGAWAVQGRSRVAYPNRASIEMDYVRTWSLAHDLWILLRTIPVVLTRRGAH